MMCVRAMRTSVTSIDQLDTSAAGRIVGMWEGLTGLTALISVAFARRPGDASPPE